MKKFKKNGNKYGNKYMAYLTNDESLKLVDLNINLNSSKYTHNYTPDELQAKSIRNLKNPELRILY